MENSTVLNLATRMRETTEAKQAEEAKRAFEDAKQRDAMITFSSHMAKLVEGDDNIKPGDNALKDGVMHALEQLDRNFEGVESSKARYAKPETLKAVCAYLVTDQGRDLVRGVADMHSRNPDLARGFYNFFYYAHHPECQLPVLELVAARG